MRQTTGKIGTLLVAAAAAVLLLAVPAHALLLGFHNITGNSSTNVEAQFSVDVTAAGPGQVSFLFQNDGSVACVITAAYFDDGTLLGIASLNNSLNVKFAQGATPPDLPGGNSISPPFEVTAGFLADADDPGPTWGISPGEWLEIIFNLQSEGTFADVEDELGSGELRIGLHVQGIGQNDDSDSFVNDPPTEPVPEPATLLLVGGGLLGMGARRLKARKANQKGGVR